MGAHQNHDHKTQLANMLLRYLRVALWQDGQETNLINKNDSQICIGLTYLPHLVTAHSAVHQSGHILFLTPPISNML